MRAARGSASSRPSRPAACGAGTARRSCRPHSPAGIAPGRGLLADLAWAPARIPAATVARSSRRAPAKARKASGSSAKTAVSRLIQQAAGGQRGADVEPRVAAQHGADEHQQQDQDLALPPDRPRGRRERREQEHVEVHPDGTPVMRGEVVRQGGGEQHDPAGQDHAAGRRDEQRQPPFRRSDGSSTGRRGAGRRPGTDGLPGGGLVRAGTPSSASRRASSWRSAWLIRRNSALSITTSLCSFCCALAAADCALRAPLGERPARGRA